MTPEVKGIRLLYSFEFDNYYPMIPHVEEDWWLLDHPDSDDDIITNNGVASSSYSDLPDTVRSFTIRSVLGVRPVLEIDNKDLLYKIESRFYLYDQIWTVLDKDIAICNRCIADSRYGTTNIWSSSDAKKHLDNFLYRNKFLSYDNKNDTDYIRRSDAILTIQRHGIGYNDPEDFSPEQAERYIISNLKKIQPVNIEEKTGQWMYDPSRGTYCDNCDENIGSGVKRYNGFCPNCGAKMLNGTPFQKRHDYD